MSQTVVQVQGTINGSVTWSASNLYEIVGPLTIAAAGVLAIQPGTTVHVDDSDGLTVLGSLQAVGTSAAPITFSPASSPQPGDWTGITVSGAGAVDLQDAAVGYAGLWSQSSKGMTLVGDRFANSGGGAVYLNDGHSDTVENNTAMNPGGVAFVEQAPVVNFGLLSGNTASGVGTLVFVVAGTAVTSTWTAQPIPWSLGDGCGPCGLDVPAGVTLTVNPGVVVKSYANALTVEGTLSAAGTQSNPIVMTSLFDNGVDGNSTGTATNPQPGDWAGITVSGAGSVNLQDATVGYSGLWSQSSKAATLVGNAFKDSNGNAVYLDDGQSDTVENNTAVNPSGIAYVEQGPAVNFGLLSGNTASGVGTLVFVVAGTAVTSTWTAQPIPWSLGDGCGPCGLDVPAGVTLTVNPGAVVKSYANALTVEGTLKAVGTTASPVIMTSLFDTSVDGNSTGTPTNPQPGDWAGITASGAGSVNLQDASVGYAGVWSQSSKAATLVGDAFKDSNGNAVYLDDGRSDTVKNNTVINPDGVAYLDQSPVVNFGLLSGNTASGTGTLVFVVAGTAVTSTWTAQPIPWSLGDGCGPCGLDVPAGATVTVNPGVVVKSYSQGLTVEGTLKAVGTTASPIVMTSLFDTSVDGNSTGTASAPQPGDWPGIAASGSGSVNLQHATVGYSGLWSQSSKGMILVGDTFTNSNGGAVYLNDGQSDTVENSTAVNPGGVAYVEQGPAVNFGLLSGNTASGTGTLVFVVAGTAVTSTWTAQPIPWSLGDGCGPCGLDVPAGVTLTAGPGMIVKSYSEGLTVEGSLSAVGTAASPIVMTSLFDNGVDGNSTGTATNPQPGDWAGISASGAGSINLQNTTVSYASTALYDDSSSGSALNAANLTNDSTGIDVNSGAVAMRGSITGTSQAAIACSWDSGISPCSIDAAYTYWGPKGPSLQGGTLVCGAVTVSPYLTATGQKTLADASAQACGGGTSSSPSAVLTAAETNANQWIGNEQIQCNDGFQDACQAIKDYQRCFAAAVKLAGQSAPFPPPGTPSSPTYDVKLLHSFASWMQNFEQPTSVIGVVLSSALEILDGVLAILDIANAYNTCL